MNTAQEKRFHEAMGKVLIDPQAEKDKAVKDYIDNLHESFDALASSLESLIKAMRAMNQRITNLERQVSER